MAVNSITFGGVNSADFGIYISGEGVFNAPKRDVEMIKIPGRNGEFALDNGRFENIEVTYPAFNFEPDDYDTFMQNLSDFRNAICAQRGYQRLTDTFHPDEYRMATYIGGLEIKPVKYNTASEFNIVFDCKPQRWLASGETAVTIGEWGETETASGDIVSVENPNGILAVKSLEVDLEPIQSGSGTPSPTNVRPISGHDSVDVTRTGKNLCDTSLVYNGYINASQQKILSNANARTLYLPCKPSTTYTVSKQAGQRFIVAESTEIPTNNVLVSNIVSDYTASSITITTTASAKYLVAFVYLSTADTGVTADQMLATCQIELGSTATAYEPYQGTTYTTALGRTVYGGTLDVTTGVLTVDRAITDLGARTWYASSGGFYSTINDSAQDAKYSICEQYAFVPTANAATASAIVSNLGNGEYAWYSSQSRIFIKDSAYSDATAFKTAMSGVHCVYPLATPQTYQLTTQQISLLTGDNNIWSDSGDITLEYGQNPSVLFNPTLFESSPFLEVEGEGIINFNGYEIDLEGVPYGEVIISDPPPAWHISTVTVTLDTTLLNIGDTIYPQVKDCDIMARIQKTSGADLYLNSVSSATNILEVKSASHTGKRGDEFHIYLYPDFGDGFVYGTSKTITCTAVIIYRVGVNPASTPTYTETIEITITYDGADTYTIAASGTGTLPPNNTRLNCKIGVPTMYGNSTKAVSDVPIYIDCDLGEAYIIIDGAYVSLNHRIDLGSELPTLGVGANEVTFDSTITELKVTPRWWKV